MGLSSLTVVVPNKQGLHARPIALITQTARPFSARFTVTRDGQEVDGRSVLELMTLCAPQGTELLLQADGEDAARLLASVAEVIQGGFGEPC